MKFQGRLVRVSTILIVAIPIILGTFTCGKKDAGEIKVGVILPLTGEGASLGEDCKLGVELAANQVAPNLKIRLQVEDSQGKPAVAVSAFNKLKANGIRLIIGDLFSAPTLALAPLADRESVLLFSPGASNPQLSGISKYVFRNYPSDNFEGKLIAKYIMNQGYKTVAVLYPTNDYGVGLKAVFAEHYLKIGGTVIAQEGYEEKETDFRTQLAKVSSGNGNADALYLPGYYAAIGRISTQAKELGLNLPIYSNIGVEDPRLFEIAGNSVDGLTYTAPAFSLELADQTVQTFIEQFKVNFGKNPGFPAAHGYDTGKILFSLIGKYGASPDSIRINLLEGQFTGVTGTMKFDENGDVLKKFVVKIITNNEFLYLDDIEL